MDGYQFRRAFSEFRLRSKDTAGTWDSAPLLVYRPTLPYGEGEQGILLSVCLPIPLLGLVPAKAFKAEFDQAVDILGQYSAPGIVALDGYADSTCGGAK